MSPSPLNMSLLSGSLPTKAGAPRPASDGVDLTLATPLDGDAALASQDFAALLEFSASPTPSVQREASQELPFPSNLAQQSEPSMDARQVGVELSGRRVSTDDLSLDQLTLSASDDVVTRSPSIEDTGNDLPLGNMLPEPEALSADPPLLTSAMIERGQHRPSPDGGTKAEAEEVNRAADPPPTIAALTQQFESISSQSQPMEVSPRQISDNEVPVEPKLLADTSPVDEVTASKFASKNVAERTASVSLRSNPVPQINSPKKLSELPSAVEQTSFELNPAPAKASTRVAVVSEAEASSATSSALLSTGMGLGAPGSNPMASAPTAQLAPASTTPATLVNSSAPIPEPAADSRTGSNLATAIEQLAETRETARGIRPELTVRHSEFGAVNMRLEAFGNDLRATLSNRDPGFVPAVQAALAERVVVSSSEMTSNTGSNGNGRGSENSSGGAYTGTNSGSGAGNEQRYGSSTGGDKGSPQPSSEHLSGAKQAGRAREGDEGSMTASAFQRGTDLFA
ncbi:MAG: hypothetical protein AAF494_06040 [Pseudomonadota bacterium]